MSEARPWSAYEIQQNMQDLYQNIENAHHELRELGELAADLSWEYKKARAKAVRSAVGANKEERDAWVDTYQVKPGVTVLDLEHERDRAKAAFSAQSKVLDAQAEQTRLIQSLHVSSREHSPS